jgi:hypothetical protein
MRNIRWTAAVMGLAIWSATAGQASAFGDAAVASAPLPAAHTSAITIDDVLCLFGLCQRSGGGCDEWGCGMNSPVVDGAAIEEPLAVATNPQRRDEPNAITIEDILCLFGVCQRKSGGGCDDWGCGMNSPVVDGAAIENQTGRTAAASDRAFHELHMGGSPNSAGFAVIAVRKGNIPYTVENAGPALVARAQAAGAPRLEGPSLVDLVFTLRDTTARLYTLRIAATNTTRFWADPQAPIRTYALTYTALDASTSRPLCTTSLNEAILLNGRRC